MGFNYMASRPLVYKKKSSSLISFPSLFTKSLLSFLSQLMPEKTPLKGCFFILVRILLCLSTGSWTNSVLPGLQNCELLLIFISTKEEVMCLG